MLNQANELKFMRYSLADLKKGAEDLKEIQKWWLTSPSKLYTLFQAELHNPYHPSPHPKTLRSQKK